MNKLLISFFFSGLIFTFLIPPFQKPDETVHFQKTLAVSQTVFNCPKDYIIQVDRQSSDLVDNITFHSMIANKNKKIGFFSYLNQIKSEKIDRRQVPMNIFMSCLFPSISYTPQAFGILISRILNLNSLLSFFIGRLTGFLIFFFWFICLNRRLPNYLKTIVLFCFGLPMTIHQLSAYSYDGAQIMFGLTVFTVLSNILISKSLTKKYLFFLLLSILGLFITRPITQIPSLIYSLRPANLTLISHLVFFMNMIVKTTLVRANFYLLGIIGIFGWLEYRLDWWVYVLIGCIFIYIVVFSRFPKKFLLPKWVNIVTIFGLITVYIIILTVLYIFSTPIGNKIAEGVQGRYFLPFLPFLIYWLVDLRNKLLPHLNKVKIKLSRWFLPIILSIITISVIRSILFRFFIF